MAHPCSSVRPGSVNGKRYSGLWMRSMKESSTREIGFSNATKWRKLEPGVCIRLHYTEMQDGNGVDKTTNAKCDAMIETMIRSVAAAEKRRWRKVKEKKPKIKESTGVRDNGGGAERFPVSGRSRGFDSRVWGAVSGGLILRCMNFLKVLPQITFMYSKHWYILLLLVN